MGVGVQHVYLGKSILNQGHQFFFLTDLYFGHFTLFPFLCFFFLSFPCIRVSFCLVLFYLFIFLWRECSHGVLGLFVLFDFVKVVAAAHNSLLSKWQGLLSILYQTSFFSCLQAQSSDSRRKLFTLARRGLEGGIIYV